MVRNILFDFDGVIAESVQAKTDAFRDLYSNYGSNIVSKVTEHHLNHGGVSRFEKFRIYHKEFLGIELGPKEIDHMANKFSQLVLEKVISAPEVPGVGQFLSKYYDKLNFWIITGTPTVEMDIIIKRRRLAKFFEGWHGSPQNKMYWCDLIIKENSLNKKETIFLGDATTDYEAALHSNIDFALRETEENKSIFKMYRGKRFKDFFELEKQLNLSN